jgi:hypothetical protein
MNYQARLGQVCMGMIFERRNTPSVVPDARRPLAQYLLGRGAEERRGTSGTQPVSITNEGCVWGVDSP